MESWPFLGVTRGPLVAACLSACWLAMLGLGLAGRRLARGSLLAELALWTYLLAGIFWLWSRFLHELATRENPHTSPNGRSRTLPLSS